MPPLPESGQMFLRMRLLFPTGAPHVGPATVRLWVEDVSFADRDAETVGSLEARVGDGRDLQGPYDLEVHAAALSPDRRYGVRVFVDRSGDGHIAAGDLLTTEQQYVRPEDVGTELNLRLTVV